MAANRTGAAMTNPHTEELRRRMGVMMPGPYRVEHPYVVAGDDSAALAYTESVDLPAIVTALNITAFLASDGAEEVMARVIDPSTWREIGHEAVRAIIELLAEKGCG